MKAPISEERLRATVAESFSVAQVIVALSLVPAGGNYKTVQTKIAAYGISTAHSRVVAGMWGSGTVSLGRPHR